MVTLKATTIEPGYYEDNKFGIRIENLIMCVKSEKYPGYLCFENITIAPYSRALIKWDMFTEEEVDQINNYHKKVYETLKPLLKDDEITLKYLERECAPHKP
jgi:Xaa-Pro aminopeptidase